MLALYHALTKRVAYLLEPPRSPEWPRVRRAHLAKEPWCRACGGTEELEVHHIKPFHLFPNLELNDDNLITLCEAKGKECHLHWGHLGSWRRINPVVRVEATSPEAGVPAPNYVPGELPPREEVA